MPDSDEPTQHFPAPGPSGDGWVLGNRYRVTGRIGSGGMADVFRAHDELLNRDVAVKVFRSVTAGADTAAGAERQRAELHALARLNHPNLITLYDGSVAGPDDPEARAFLVMELVEGPNLGNRIETGPLPTEPEVRAIGAQIADALAYVHEQGMVHRDVKPANILLGAGTGSEQVRARLSDFGIVRLVGSERLTQADSTLGTASYLAPEQARGSAVGPPADIYALGLTLIEALTGVRSFDGPTPLEAVAARLDRDPEVPRNLPQPWPGLLAAMTSRDPAARPAARQVADALRGGGSGSTTQYVPPVGGAAAGATTVLAGAGIGAAGTGGMPPVRPPVSSPAPPLPEPEPNRRNTGLIVGLILAAALIVLAILILVATSGGDDSGGNTGPTSTGPSTSASTTPSPTSSSPTESSPTSEPETPTVTETRTRTREAPSTTAEPTTPTPTTTPPGTRTTPPTSSTSQTGTSDGNG